MLIDLCFPTKLVSGEGCVKNNAKQIASLGARAIIITGKNGARASGALDDMERALTSEGVCFAQFDGVGANPTVDMCTEAARAAREAKAEFVVAIGGGSVMDAAKAVCLMLKQGVEDAKELYNIKEGEYAPLVCVGTTSGTGSEADGASVITDCEGKKTSLPHKQIWPTYSFCDPRYTFSMDLRQTVSTGLDALCHAVESFFKNSATDISRVFALAALDKTLPALREIARGGFRPDDYAQREALQYGSVYAGMAIAINGTGYPHPAGYLFTEQGILPHGAACALFLNHYIDVCAQRDPISAKLLDARVGGLEGLEKVVSALTLNNITVSGACAADVRERVAKSGNIKGVTGGYDDALLDSIAELYLLPEQRGYITGGWLFGQV